MLKRFGIYVAAAALLCGSTACNDSDENYEISVDYASTQVTAFSLRSDSKVLNNLDSIFFSIDLVRGRIFNADSLPFGTKTDRLLVDITTDGCSTVEIHFPRENKTDSIVDYLTNKNDSIDFSRGPVKLHLVSYDKIATRDYYIDVNVHKTISDSLYWDLEKPASLPSDLSTIKAQRTLQYGNKVYTLTTDGARNACMHVADSPVADGSSTRFTFPFTPRVNSLTATTSLLYILAENGDLYSSANGIDWNSCGVNWKSITAPYGSTLLGIADVNGTLTHVTYPLGGATSAVKPNFPVTGNSDAIRYTSEWGLQPQIITVGGLKADGTTTPTAWAYDGTAWACIADETPMDAEGLAVFPYYCCRTDTNTWVASTRSVLVAMGGRHTAHKMQDTIYISYDLGFNWSKAPVSMQLPKKFPALYGSQVIVNNEVMHSRAIRPITEWDTPYIYMYGGYTVTDELMPRVYRGVINRLQFKPLQ